MINIGNKLAPIFCLKPSLFALGRDELKRHMQYEVPWCMLLIDDTILANENRRCTNGNLEWRSTLKNKEFQLSRNVELRCIT